MVAFAEQHWHKIENMGLTVSQLEKCLIFICYNYEIKFLNKVFKQKKGCPMGAHFAPPFAVITMEVIEREALKIISEVHDINLSVYKRYIDDCILGPVTDIETAKMIHETFNSINKNIQFTLEYPDKNQFLSFLDIEVRIRNKIEYK